MANEGYCKRTWLNNEDSISTGSVVAFYGPYQDDEGKLFTHRYLEIADCHRKIRLHQNSLDADQDFINKLKLLRDDIDLFIQYLENKL